MDLNLSKAESTKLASSILSKNGFSTNVSAKVNVVLDGSSSMDRLYSNGTVSTLVNRILSIGQHFDDDGTIDVFDFSSGKRFRQLKPSTQADWNRKFSLLGGGTEYSPVLEHVRDFYYKEESNSGLFGLFKSKKPPEGRDGFEDKQPVFTVFVTDGESQNELTDEYRINDLLSQYPDMFIMFVVINPLRYTHAFTLLKNIALKNPNADMYDVGDLTQSDQELFEGILSKKAIRVLDKK